jgi:hypothetical protein
MTPRQPLPELPPSGRARAAALALRRLAADVELSANGAWRRKADYAPPPVASLIRQHVALWEGLEATAAAYEAAPSGATLAAQLAAVVALMAALDIHPGLSPLNYPDLLTETTLAVAAGKR